MALQEFLYPSLELRLILARSLEVDLAAAQGTLSPTYQEAAARITLSVVDAKRLNLKEGAPVQVASKHGQVVVRLHIDEDTPEGLAIMPPTPYSHALLPPTPPHQRVTITIKSTTKPPTPIEELP